MQKLRVLRAFLASTALMAALASSSSTSAQQQTTAQSGLEHDAPVTPIAAKNAVAQFAEYLETLDY